MCSSIYELIRSREAAQAYMNEAIEQGWTDGGWERGITIWNAAENGLNASLHVVRHSDFRVLVLKSFENFQQWRQISIDNDGPWWKRNVVLALGSCSTWFFCVLCNVHWSATGLQPDIILMNSVISAAAKAGDLTMVKELFQQTLDAGGMTKTMGGRFGAWASSLASEACYLNRFMQ